MKLVSPDQNFQVTFSNINAGIVEVSWKNLTTGKYFHKQRLTAKAANKMQLELLATWKD